MITNFDLTKAFIAIGVTATVVATSLLLVNKNNEEVREDNVTEQRVASLPPMELAKEPEAKIAVRKPQPAVSRNKLPESTRKEVRAPASLSSEPVLLEESIAESPSRSLTEVSRVQQAGVERATEETSAPVKRTFAWDPVALAPQWQERVEAEMVAKGYRKIERWQEATVLVSLYTERRAYQEEMPPVERVVYSPYGPYYPQYEGSGYRRYQDGEQYGDYEEVVNPGYRIEDHIVEARIEIRAGLDKPWSGSAWRLQGGDSIEEVRGDLVEEILEEF